MASILFVCTGNICRSPTADAIMRQIAVDHNFEMHIDSAGTDDYHIGSQPDKRTMKIAAENGVDMTPLRARQITAEDFEIFDYLLAMDAGHMRIMRGLAPEQHAHKIKLFLDFVPEYEGQDVPDPYFGGIDGFTHVYDLCKQGCESLFSHIMNER